MPDWKTHFIFSLFLVITWISIFYFADLQLSFGSLVALVVLTVFTSLFPDIDTRRSKIRNVVSMAIAAIVAGVYMFFYMETWYYAPVYFILLYLIFKYLPTKHRGITHTFKFSVLFSAGLASVYMVFNPFMLERLVFWFVVVFSSYALHLALDRIGLFS